MGASLKAVSLADCAACCISCSQCDRVHGLLDDLHVVALRCWDACSCFGTFLEAPQTSFQTTKARQET